MPIYTRHGDFGKTSTYEGVSVSKSSALIQLQGSIDEVNSHMGYLRSLICETMEEKTESPEKDLGELKEADRFLKIIQYHLFAMGADISGEFTTTHVVKSDISKLEEKIDWMTEKTGELNSFIYLSGHKLATYTHVCRSIVRRAERDFVRYIEVIREHGRTLDVPEDYKYMNRLADYLYQLARYFNKILGIEEETIHIQ